MFEDFESVCTRDELPSFQDSQHNDCQTVFETSRTYMGLAAPPLLYFDPPFIIFSFRLVITRLAYGTPLSDHPTPPPL